MKLQKYNFKRQHTHLESFGIWNLKFGIFIFIPINPVFYFSCAHTPYPRAIYQFLQSDR